MSKQQSELLTQFYKDYLAWLNAGAPIGKIFTRSAGLCHNLSQWAGLFPEAFEDLIDELQDQLEEDYGESDFPFNNCDWPHEYYKHECAQRHTHLNEHRIAWVKSHV